MPTQRLIYELRHLPTGLCYIGCTRNALQVRWKQHQECARRKPHHPLYSRLLADGPGAFSVSVLETTTALAGPKRERQVILERDTIHPRGLNTPFPIVPRGARSPRTAVLRAGPEMLACLVMIRAAHDAGSVSMPVEIRQSVDAAILTANTVVGAPTP